MQLDLAEDQLVVERHLEAPLSSRAQRYLDHHRGPGPEDLSRQTDGVVQVVSGNAVFDRDAVLGIDHAPSVSAIPTDAAQMRVLKPGWQLQAVSEEPINADVAEPDQRDRARRAHTGEQRNDAEEPGQQPGVAEVVERRPGPRAAQVPKHEKVGREDQRDVKQPGAGILPEEEQRKRQQRSTFEALQRDWIQKESERMVAAILVYQAI